MFLQAAFSFRGRGALSLLFSSTFGHRSLDKTSLEALGLSFLLFFWHHPPAQCDFLARVFFPIGRLALALLGKFMINDPILKKQCFSPLLALIPPRPSIQI